MNRLIQLLLMGGLAILLPDAGAQHYYTSKTASVRCPWCRGIGSYTLLFEETVCRKCHGTRFYTFEMPDLREPSSSDPRVRLVCPSCDGCRYVTGYREGEAMLCQRCGGKGYVEKANPGYQPVKSRASKVYCYGIKSDNLAELMAELSPEERYDLYYAFYVMYVFRGDRGPARWHGMTAAEILRDFATLKPILMSSDLPPRYR